MKKLLTFILGIIVGFVLTIGGIVGGTYFMLNRKGGMGMIDNMLPESIKLSKEIKDKSIMGYGKDLIGAFSNMDTLTIGKLEKTLGYPAISSALADHLGGVDIKDRLVKDLAKAVAESLTVNSVVTTMGIALPDLPMFQSEDFLNSPITTAFAKLDEQTLDGIFVVVYDEDASEDNPASSKFMQTLGKKTINEMSKDMDGIIDDTLLSDIIENADEDSLITHFLHLKVGELSTEVDTIINGLTLAELMDIDEDSPKILQALADYALATQYAEDGVTVVKESLADALDTLPIKDFMEIPENSHIWDYLGLFNLKNLADGVDNMKISHAIDTTAPDCHIIIVKLADTKVSQIGSAVADILADTTIGELITINENDPATEPILLALKDVKLSSTSLNQAMASFTIKDVFSDYSSGVLGLVAPETPLKDLPVELSLVIEQTNLYRLDKLGIYSLDFSGSSVDTKAYVYNQTPHSIVNGYIKVVQNPLQAGTLLLPQTISFAGGILDQATIDSWGTNFSNGMTIELNGDTTIASGTVFSSLFNINANSYNLTIESSVSINLNNSGDWGYMFIKGSNVVGKNNMTSAQKYLINDSYVDAVMIE